MDHLLYEIALRSQHKARTLHFEARKLGDTLDGLKHENKELKRLQRSQTREIHERHDFVNMANLSLKGLRRDVRSSEESCVGAQTMHRRKNKKVIQLENESKRLTKLVELGSTLPTLEELERRIEKAHGKLERKNDSIAKLQLKLEDQDKAMNKEQQMEKRRLIKLQNEIEETDKECQELVTRIKAAERKIHETNIYSRKHRCPPRQTVPAITWYPPSDEQSPTNKVEKWLDKHAESNSFL
ncbi:lebercilin-like [Montipora foliosa]|uniref:lebercilin-like n=1 Tax=Montipora foliosa TaxID=591990 RepID=UPI0035F13A5E